MLLPEIKEREYRFKLALRMVLPVFALVFALIFHTFITSSETLNNSFYIESILVLVFSIYFIFYLIYKGFDTKITDNVSKAFTREYLNIYLKEEIKNSKEYTLLLLSLDNLYEINKRYGLNNGDKVLFETVKWIGEYLKSKNIVNFPIGHINSGNFIIGLHGDKNRYKTILELICLKSEEFKVNDIKIQISGAINDITFSKNIDYLIENLLELQSRNRDYKTVTNRDDDINPNELESDIISAIERKDLVIFTQEVFEKDFIIFKECFIKLRTENKKLIHQKNYLKILDKLRLMREYDLIALEKIVDICKKSKNEKFALTVSATSIRNNHFLTKIKEIFHKNKCLNDRILLIFSESEYYPFIDKFNTILQELKDLGIIIVIDRFGSLHTSFLYLRDLNIDIVRFDSFYSKKIDEKNYKNILKGFHIMAHEKGVKTWIKMIENKALYALAEELEIDYLQGRYLALLQEN
jgi:EAL domain-containing protein (putative c-di-GMP-specific phosphodiesterase class I)